MSPPSSIEESFRPAVVVEVVSACVAVRRAVVCAVGVKEVILAVIVIAPVDGTVKSACVPPPIFNVRRKMLVSVLTGSRVAIVVVHDLLRASSAHAAAKAAATTSEAMHQALNSLKRQGSGCNACSSLHGRAEKPAGLRRTILRLAELRLTILRLAIWRRGRRSCIAGTAETRAALRVRTARRLVVVGKRRVLRWGRRGIVVPAKQAPEETGGMFRLFGLVPLLVNLGSRVGQLLLRLLQRILLNQRCLCKDIERVGVAAEAPAAGTAPRRDLFRREAYR